MTYNKTVVLAFFKSMGLPEPEVEYQFAKHIGRKWRWDFSWVHPGYLLALEVQGAIFTQGRHTRGASLRLEHEKLNAAAVMGWRVLYVEPVNLCMVSTANMIREALEL
jgi:hypothetical protein